MKNQPIKSHTGVLGTTSAVLILYAWVALAQSQDQSLPYDMLLSRNQLEATRRAWNEGLSYIPGEVLVKFRDGVSSSSQVRAMSEVRGGIDNGVTRWIGDSLLMKALAEPNAEQVASTLRAQPEVLWAEPNHFRRLKMVPNDPGYTRQWNFELINIPLAWDINNGATDKVRVAVVDSGVTTVTQSYTFKLWTGQAFETIAVPFRVNPDLGSSRVLTGRDFIFWTGPVVDMVGHGTHVAGTILQETNNSVGLAGIAHHAQLMPLKVCLGYWEIQFALSQQGIPGFVDPQEGGGCTDSAIAEAIRYAADNAAHVINVSLGGADPAPVILDALQYAVSRGLFVSIAVGNEFTEGNPVSYPAKYAEQLDGATSVGAVGPSGRRAYYSNTGSYIEVMAPGGDAQEGGASGAIYQSSLLDDDFDPFGIVRPRFDRYAEVPYQGTSMAAPHVAGVAALLYSQGITTPSGIEGALKSFARDLGANGRDNEFGYGLVDAPAALRGRGVGAAK